MDRLSGELVELDKQFRTGHIRLYEEDVRVECYFSRNMIKSAGKAFGMPVQLKGNHIKEGDVELFQVYEIVGITNHA